MSIFSDLQDRLYDATRNSLNALGYTGASVIFSNQKALEPEKTYCVVHILDVQQHGHKSDAGLNTKTNIYETVTHYHVAVQFSFIGEDAGDVAIDFRHNVINNHALQDEYRKQNFGFLYRGNLIRSPQKRETDWVDNFDMDINFSFALFTKQQTDYINTVVVNNDAMSSI